MNKTHGSMIEGWENIEIEKVVLKSKLKDPTKEPEEAFKYVDVSGVSNTLFKIEDVTILKGKDAPSRARKLINYEDVMFATVRPTLMRIAIVPKELDGEICSTGYCILKPNKELVSPLFLYYSLLPDCFIEKISKLQRGASYPAIRDTDLKSQIISLSPLPEQRKIAYILSTIQKAIEQQDKLIKTTAELKKALMQKLFTEGTKGEKQKQTESLI
jgi:type I restriction enzyme S subunit